ncbi:MAG: phage tail protein [Lacticaseibacillus paracasei]|nr:phage tail protein [Lacticaseibacillus paracasei]MDN6636399.1 phage tail protein [Lacticaseibacillus paracasei]
MPDTPSRANDIELELTIGDMFFAMKKQNETASTDPVFDTSVIRIPNIKKIAFKGNGKSNDIYASGKKFGTITQETSIEVTHTHIGMPIAVLDAMKGIAAKHGVEFGSTLAQSMPEFAIGFDTWLANGQHDGIWLTSCTLNPAVNETHATSEESFKEVNPDVVYNAGGLRNSSIYYSRYNSARDSADLTVDDFFKQVIFSPEQLETIAKEKAIPKV